MVARPRSFALLLLAGSIPVVACLEPAVVGKTDGAGANGGATSAVTGIQVNATFASSGAGGGAAAGYDGTALVTWNDRYVETCTGCPADLTWLVLDTDGVTCDAPQHVPQDASSAWRVAIGLPPSRVAVGSHVLADIPGSEFRAAVTEVSDIDASASSTAGGGVDAGPCVLDILEITDTTMRVAVTTCSPADDGTYELPRCEPTTLPPEAVGQPGVGSGEGGGTPDPDGLVLVVGDEVATCADDSLACDADASRLALALPPALLSIGTYDLADIDARRCGTAVVLGGTLDVLAIDDTSMIVQLASPDVPAAVRDQEVRVERCP